MPELPEVETILRGLRKNIYGEEISSTFSSGARVFRSDPKLIAQALPGESILDLERRGKYLILRTSRNFLVIHLGMTGQLLLENRDSAIDPPGKPSDPHVHLILCFRSGKLLLYRDPRKFGRILLFDDKSDLSRFFVRMGIEPLSDSFTIENFRRVISGKKGKIKPFLLNQSYICGLGNIYADEILFASSLHPETPIPDLTEKDKITLHRFIPKILAKGIHSGGTTFRDYRNSEGGEGSFQELLNVYGREGLECRKCGNLIRRIQVGGRSSHYCSECQRGS
jgi:formamidopyrimidine-DNA glycosylase